jgi:Small, acid-soluble spore proteins, alpha/beta type
MLQQNQQNNSNPLLVPQAEHMLELMKHEIAQEFGITLGAETTARDNGRVGGELTKRLVAMAKEQLANGSSNHNMYH